MVRTGKRPFEVMGTTDAKAGREERAQVFAQQPAVSGESTGAPGKETEVYLWK